MFAFRHPFITFDADDGAGAGDGGQQQTTTGAGDGDGGTTTTTGKTFTQEDVDRVVESRLARERAKYADYDDLKSAAERLKEFEDAQKSEAEKLQEQAAKAQETATKATAERDRALRKAAVVTAAVKAGAVDPDAVFALLNAEQLTIGDDGQVSGAEEAVKALLDEKTYLVGTTPPPPGDGGARGGSTGQGSLDQQLQAAVEKEDWPEVQRLNALKLGGLLANQTT